MHHSLYIKLTALALILTSCITPSPEKSYREYSGTIFKTLFHIKYEAAASLDTAILAELQRFDASMNPFNPHSIIARVNRNDSIAVDQWFTQVFDAAQLVAEQSDGMFDITCSPYINLWGFGFGKRQEATPERLDSIAAFVGYRKVRLHEGRIVKDDPRLTLNCSAIAKGFAVDVIGALLTHYEVENYMVEIGGEVAVKGCNNTGKPWRIGINKPIDDSSGAVNELEEILSITDIAVATSGNYRNYYVKKGKKYAHTINPKTGYPSEQQILSATIIAPSCLMADAYATACMAMGLKDAIAMQHKTQAFDYYFIYADSTETYRHAYSKGMKRYRTKD